LTAYWITDDKQIIYLLRTAQTNSTYMHMIIG